MGFFDFLKKKKVINEIPPSTWLPTQPPVYDYDRSHPTEDALKRFQKTNDLKEMGRILAENGVISVPKDKYHNTLGQSLEHLDENGELPFGWAYHNKDFTDKIEKEFSYFLNCWTSVRGKDTFKEYGALRSLIMYIKDAEKLCKSKGECFSKWFFDCVANREYLEKRQADLDYIKEHFDELLKKESCKRDIEQNLLPHLKQDLLKIIQNNPGILQTNIYKMFDKAAKEYISSELYFLEKDGLLVREKSGRTYSIKFRNDLSR